MFHTVQVRRANKHTSYINMTYINISALDINYTLRFLKLMVQITLVVKNDLNLNIRRLQDIVYKLRNLYTRHLTWRYILIL